LCVAQATSCERRSPLAADARRDERYDGAVDASPLDASGDDAHATDCRGLVDQETRVLFTGTVVADRGVVWSWSQHHYALADGRTVGSEVWWPWILPGPRGAIIGSDQPTLAYRLSLDTGLRERLSQEALRPWTGTWTNGLLLGDDDVVIPVRLGALMPVLTAA
jgi:hypothetical protein